MSFLPTVLRVARTQTPRRLRLATPIASSSSSSSTQFRHRTLATATNLEQQFTSPTREHVTHLRTLLSAKSSLLSTLDGSATGDELDGFNVDWMGKYKGKSAVVVKPKTTQEVADVMKYCYEQSIAIVPQGGNTGLVGGSIPVRDELVLSLANLTQIRSFDPVSGILVADAGVILESADNYLADQGFIFPLDLGAKGSCQIGGNVAANAGGLRLMRYGSLHGSVLGLEVVLPDGTIWNGLSKLRKDNTGFDIKQLFIGSEGTIGIITAISILCPPRPKITNVAIFSLDSYEAVQKVYTESKKHLGEILSAFEMFDAKSYEFVRHHQLESGGAKKVFETEGEFYCLIETGGSNAEHDEEKMTNLVEHLMTNEMVLDGALAQDTTQAQAFWALRETITESIGKSGKVYKYDLSVPLDKMYGLVEKMRIRLQERGYLKDDGSGEVLGCLGFGHMGDGNLHLNIVAREFKDEIKDAIEPYVYELVAENSGSISAEHGLGLMKAPYIRYSRDETAIELMKKIKGLFDPKGLLNPGKYII